MSELARLIKDLEPYEAKGFGSLRIDVAEIKLILQALRDGEKMREALAQIEQGPGPILSGSPGPLFGAGFSSGAKWAAELARQALTGEGHG